jgi:hypothetical protein
METTSKGRIPKILPGDGDPRHGTKNGYNNLNCSCEECRAAHAKSHKEYMHAHPEQLEKGRLRERERRATKKTSS